MRRNLALCGALLLFAALAALARDDDDKADKDEAHKQEQSEAAGPLTLTAAQQQAVGVVLEQPLRLKSAPLIEAYGTVLDPATFVSDAGHVESTRALAAASMADRARLERLYREDLQASLKSLQAVAAQAVEASAQARAAELGFRLQWGPLANQSAEQRAVLMEALSRGHAVLLRADVPAGDAGGALDPRALVEVNGASVSAQVLGPLSRTDAQAQTAGWLLELTRVPPGFGPGARALVQLRAATALSGLLVPAAALVYSEAGAFVYRQAAAQDSTSRRYVAAPVQALTRVGSAWLVAGLNPSDRIVVQGAGVLWSLQGISSFSAAEEEHD
jgi:hypothetical protein